MTIHVFIAVDRPVAVYLLFLDDSVTVINLPKGKCFVLVDFFINLFFIVMPSNEYTFWMNLAFHSFRKI